MKLNLTYKNDYGTVVLSGENSPFCITHIEGLGFCDRNYITASYSGYDGQETLSSVCLPRTLTLSGDVVSENVRTDFADAVDILRMPGYLYIRRGDLDRRIYCNQTHIPDAQQILQGRICSFTLQFVCDSPFFEDSRDTSVPLYRRTKMLSTPFTLPSLFGQTLSEAEIRLSNRNTVEPLIRIVCPQDPGDATSICITNHTNGAKVCLNHAPAANEEILIDIKNRTVKSSLQGNILNSLSDDTFLGDFVLTYPSALLSVAIGDINSGIFIECVYNNKYNESMLI